jgi:hypothetical protein
LGFVIVLVFSILALPSAGLAQKNSGPAPAPPYIPPTAAPMRPVLPPPVAAPPAPVEADNSARSLAQQLPLDPATRDLRNRLPADVPGTIRRLGLRVPQGPRTDMRGRTPSAQEVTNALAH